MFVCLSEERVCSQLNAKKKTQPLRMMTNFNDDAMKWCLSERAKKKRKRENENKNTTFLASFSLLIFILVYELQLCYRARMRFKSHFGSCFDNK